MEWNTTVDKLILEWLANRTPPTCIRVNILSMALAINPGFKVVKEIPCVKHIRNLRTVLSLVTKSVADKYIGESAQIKQLHTDGTGHKGTEIVNIVCGILTKSNALRTLCLAGDVIAEDGTAECQSLAIVDQFSESGRLLERWREETITMYAKDPELPSLLVQIPRKESLCVSRILGATLSADNCSTACLGQSRLSERIMEIAKQQGITDKKKLVVHYGHCQNHMRNGWCNAIGIRFERRALDTLQHDIPLFAPHLRIGGELNNLHR